MRIPDAKPCTNAGCPIQAFFWLEWDPGTQCATSERPTMWANDRSERQATSL
jgi:hypothetical protein